MKVYGESEVLYLETHSSGVGHGACLLQVKRWNELQKIHTSDNRILRLIAFASKGLSSAGTCYSNIERETLGILHSLEKFHHYPFPRE